jgi:hypothetical protein
MEQRDVIFGFQEQWQAFQARNDKFLSVYPNLEQALNIAFVREASFSKPEERVVFALGRVCVEDFLEVLLLAGNGYGIGAQKILRGLYERAVTMMFLSENPGDVAAFLNFHSVAQRRLLMAVQQTFGQDVVPKRDADRTESEYQAIKDNYMITDCSNCGTKRLNHTWHNKLNLVAMAHKTPLGRLIVAGYYLPMGQTHSTVRSLLSRLEESDSGGLGFKPDAQPKEADMALVTAHDIMLGVLETQKNYFKLGDLGQPLQTCLQDFLDVWSKDKRSNVAP